MAFEPTSWVWMNGRLTHLAQSGMPISTHTLHYGSGVFEGIRCYPTESGPAIFKLEEHVARLFRSAEAYGLLVPYSDQEMQDACCEVVRRNGFDACYVRPIVYLGSDNLGIRGRCPVEVAVLAWPWANQLGEDGQRRGVRVTVSSWVKFSSRMMPTTAKGCGQYLNSRLAVREAAERGYDEALLLDERGQIAEGAVENIFLVRDGRLFTNDERSSILLGITRGAVIDLARDAGFEVEVGFLSLADLLGADEAFFTGTATEITPIREVDGRLIGESAPGPLTRSIQRLFSDATAGRQSRYRDWLRPVVSTAREAVPATLATEG
jgi:branched-chain amino acid aminotransferase